MERRERVNKVHEFINECRGNESKFNDLHNKFNEEFELETEFNPDIKVNRYLWNLRQTKIKQLAVYLSNTDKKSSENLYNDFVSNFSTDTTWAVH